MRCILLSRFFIFVMSTFFFAHLIPGRRWWVGPNRNLQLCLPLLCKAANWYQSFSKCMIIDQTFNSLLNCCYRSRFTVIIVVKEIARKLNKTFTRQEPKSAVFSSHLGAHVSIRMQYSSVVLLPSRASEFSPTETCPTSTKHGCPEVLFVTLTVPQQRQSVVVDSR